VDEYFTSFEVGGIFLPVSPFLNFSCKLLFGLNCFGGSGSILRPIRVSLGDEGGAGLLYTIVGLRGGESNDITLLVGLLSSNVVYFFSKLSLKKELSCTTVGEDLFECV
jgi:hypothetical protein